jgi:hypothetical protein
MTMTQREGGEFERAADQTRRIGLAGQLWGFLRANKKWWLLPILLVFALFSLLIVLSGSGVAPIIYTLF